tara:strand:- start:462 stop:704 length:243 start_codon:yes stop_codon:yes gene_type:complete
MIDTDKYEGHTDDYIWTWKQYASHFDHDADRALIQDAPLLLEEVKRLRKWKAEVERICRTMNGPNRDTALFIMTNEVEEE